MNWKDFLIYVISTAVTPGPNTISSMSAGVKKGFIKALPFNFGILTGFSFIMVLCTVLASTLNSVLPVIEKPILFVGAAYLLWLAWHTYKSTGVEDKDSGTAFKDGLLLQLVNIKIYFYGLISMQVYILPHYKGNIPVLLFFSLLLAFIGFLFTLLWSAFGSFFKTLFSEHGKVVNTILALALVYCAVSLFMTH